MKMTDMPVSGSEYNKRSSESVIYVAKCVEGFVSLLNTFFTFNSRKTYDELSYVLYLIHSIKYELIKIKVCIEGQKEKDVIINLVHRVGFLEASNCFRGIYFNKISVRHMDIVRKSILCNKFYHSYVECIDSINSCRLSAGAIADYKRIIWSENDVLVGSLRNRQQLDVALKSGFYHVPAHMIPDDKLSVSYIAIYQSKNFFADDAGVRYFAKVLSVDKVVRKSIQQIPSDSEEFYYVFNVSDWQSLDRPIKADRGGALLNFTNLYMLLRADTVDELYFTDERVYKLYSSIKASLRGGYNKVATSYGSGIIAIDDGIIYVYKNNTPIYSVSVSDYVKNPVVHFRTILRCCQ